MVSFYGTIMIDSMIFVLVVVGVAMVVERLS